MRSGITPHSDGVSYWSAAREVNRGHFTSSGLIPAFSDLDLRSIIESGRAPFVDFPIGYPWLVGILAFAVGVIWAQFVVEVAEIGRAHV